MQELLGIRVIACFDEQIIGNVNTNALLSTAASLAGCPAGFSQDEPARVLRVDPRVKRSAVIRRSTPSVIV